MTCFLQTALERQDLSCTYLAQHELESVVVVIIIVVIVIVIILTIFFTRADVGDAGVLLVRLCGTVNGTLATTPI